MFEFIAPMILWLALMPIGVLFLVMAFVLVDDATRSVARRRRAKRASISAVRAAT